ncbi:MAG: HAD family phosphatase [Olegusella sp.]|nr:HAD family phosphatase [Olegusella sp.]
MVRNVMFDFGGVLCRWDRHYVLSQFFAEQDIPVVEPSLFEHWLEMDAGTLEYGDYMRDALPRIPERLRPQAGRFFAGWYYAMTPIEDMWALVARLLARRVPLYLLSNGSKPYARRLHELCPLLDCFEAELVSADVRMMKPHADIYELAAREFGIVPAETVFIDDVQENVDGAIACGYRALRYTGDADALLAELESILASGN